MCWEFDNAGNTLWSVNGYGVSPPTLKLSLNGISYQFPFAVGGIVGPAAITPNDLAVWGGNPNLLIDWVTPIHLTNPVSAGLYLQSAVSRRPWLGSPAGGKPRWYSNLL